MAEERRFVQAQDGALAGLKVTIIGRGPLGLFTALALAQNGALVQVHAAAPLSQGLGFVNAAGLIEPVATLEPRSPRWTRDTLTFCEWAAPDPLWGLVRRSVLFLSDDEDATKQPWMSPMNWRAAKESELCGGRAHGAWFDTFVIQPDLAIPAIQRECKNLGVLGGAKDVLIGAPVAMRSVEETAMLAKTQKSDLFILAPGLGLASMSDVEDLVGMAAGLSAGIGVTIRIPAERFEQRIDHVLMDDDELGYFIPQLTHVVAGGTNDITEHDDPVVTAGAHPALMNEWEAEVRSKMERLLPGSRGLEGELLLGARPMRGRTLTHWTAEFDPPGLLLSGAGGSGWTFGVGIAHDVCRLVGRRFERDDNLFALGTRAILPTGPGEDWDVAA